jgi:hypothetical protein
MNKLTYILIFSMSFPLLAWETDNFTSRRKILEAPKEESLTNLYTMNDQMNKEIVKVLDNFGKDYDCTEDVAKLKNNRVPLIYSWIDDALGGTHAEIERFAEESSDIKLYDHNRKVISLSSNIYGKQYGLQGSFNLDGHVVGPDKVGHFVDQGYDLIRTFINNGSNKDSFKLAMQESNDLEEEYFGLIVSDVKSYGDMSANFSGLKFFYNLLSGDSPQLSCDKKSKKYKLNYDFNWSEYVNDSWDEGVNCSFFESVENPYVRKSAKSNGVSTSDIEKIYPPANDDEVEFRKKLKSFKPPLSCPDSKGKCREIASMNCSNYFISPKCIRQVDKKVSCNISNFDELFSVNRKANYSFDRGNEEKTNEKNWYDFSL